MLTASQQQHCRGILVKHERQETEPQKQGNRGEEHFYGPE